LAVPGAIRTDWRGGVAALLVNFLPGEQMGPALVDTLFGDVPPQAKLPVTLPIGENDEGMTQEQYPGAPCGSFALCANYTEGHLIGYRWYERHKFTPAFPFGHGLTFGSFSYSDLSITGRTVAFTVARTGAGCDTPQLYLSSPTSSTDPTLPVKTLKHFQKVCAASQQVSFVVGDRDVSVWDVASGAWVVESGTWGVFVGTSSADVRLSGSMNI